MNGPARNRWLVPVGDRGHLELTMKADGRCWFSVEGLDDYNDGEHDFTVELTSYERTLLIQALLESRPDAERQTA